MKISRVLSGAGIGAVVLSLALVGAGPAGAHTGSLFTVISPSESPSVFATISQTDATTTALPGGLPDAGSDGLEIFNETGYVLLRSGDPTESSIATWDHTTGLVGTTVALTAPLGTTINNVHGLDTTVDGTIIAIADLSVLDGEFPVDVDAIISIDPATGLIAQLVDITGASSYFDSLSTDPTTGITYLWVDEDDGTPQYIVLDLVAGTYDPTVDLLQVQDDLGGGYMKGADFDTSGTLWFFYGSQLASLTGSPSETVGAVSSGINGGDVADINLAYDPYVAPPKAVLAETGLNVGGIVAGGLALLGAGLVVVFASRRRTA